MKTIFNNEKYHYHSTHYGKLLQSFVYLLGEPLCLICQNKIDFDNFSSIEGICKSCFNEIKSFFESYKRCPICSAVLKGSLCDKFHHKNIENIFSLIPLNDQLYNLYLNAKYRKNKRLMNLFSDIFDFFLPQTIIDQYSNFIDYIVFVPISINKKLIRSYNPSKIFAKILAKKIKKPIVTVFSEKGFQYFHIQRKENINYFTQRFIFNNKLLSIKKIDITNKNILLVDDIYTTGKTASFLADLLILNKASKIYLCTFFNHR